MTAPLIHREAHDGIRVLRLARGKGNSLNAELLQELHSALQESRDAAGLVLTGEGRFFSSGLDLVELPQLQRPAMRAVLQCLEDTVAALFGHPRPVVAAINGHAVAGGCVLALCCDARVMARGDYKIGLNELAHGIGLPVSVQEITRAQTSPGWLAEVALGAALYDPETALRRGLINEVLEPAQVLPRALEVASAWAAHPPQAFAATKAALRAPVLETIRRLRATDAGERWLDSWFSPPTQAHLAAVRQRLQSRA
ncbi:MAG: enoyl-CoA hydratase/isomerase family protein [Planctomycetota bacterium]|nr:MAG: enoyl-CoA hydratase/isomerase family protein [Planctomycetota bacterium]